MRFRTEKPPPRAFRRRKRGKNAKSCAYGFSRKPRPEHQREPYIASSDRKEKKKKLQLRTTSCILSLLFDRRRARALARWSALLQQPPRVPFHVTFCLGVAQSVHSASK